MLGVLDQMRSTARWSSRWRVGLATPLALALGACAQDISPSKTTASLNTVVLTADNVTTLLESDSSYVGRPIGLAVSSRTEYFILDRYRIEVLRFDSTGRFVGRFGREGYGPNEFKGPGPIELLDDSTALIADVLRRDFTIWDVNADSVRTRVSVTGEPGRFAASNGAIIGTTFDRFAGKVATKWQYPDMQPQHFGTLPAAFAPTNRFATIYGSIPFVIFGDSVAYFTGESNYLRLADTSWAVADSILIPRARRRGVPDVIDTTIGVKRNIYDVAKQLSRPHALHRLSNDRFAVVHLDAEIRNNVGIGSAYLTIVRRDGTSRCIDLPLPVRDSTAIPSVAFRGDTMFVLDQHIVEERAVVDLRRFTLSDTVC